MKRSFIKKKKEERTWVPAFAGTTAVVGPLVLWILMSISLMASTVLAMTQIQKKRALNDVDDVQFLYLVLAGQFSAYDKGFDVLDEELRFKDKNVSITKEFSESDEVVKIKSTVQGERSSKTVEVAWKKTGARWTAIYWKEY